MSAKLFIGNLSKDASSDELGTLFSEVGFVQSCLVVTDPASGRSKGYAFIQMKTQEAAEAAKAKFQGHALRGQPLNVVDAQTRDEQRYPAGYSRTEGA